MILVETNFSGILRESSSDGKKLYLTGIFMECENKNQNGRIYQRTEMQREVDRVNAKIAGGESVLGELDHPKNRLEVHLENVSHDIKELRLDDDNIVYGKAEILPTPKGNIARSLIEAGIKIGVSSRGSGSVNSKNIVEDFSLSTVDLVATPSVRTAIPASIWESLQLYKNGGEINSLAEAIRHDKAAQKYFDKEIKKFIDSLF